MNRNRIMLGLAAILMAGSLALAQNPELPDVNRAYKHGIGTYLVDADGLTLYARAADQGDTSSCYDNCATNWPPVLLDGAPVAGSGLDSAQLGSTERTDGSAQLTYGGMPLYHFASDASTGDLTGQARGGVWYAVSPDGNPIGAPFGTFAGTNDVLLNRAYKYDVGNYLVDAAGLSLYAFTDDAGSSTCAGDCATNWPPLVISAEGQLGSGLDSSLAGTTVRDDDSLQLTYAGHPLYRFNSDTATGDIAGQGLADKWYLVSPDGSLIPVAAAAEETAEAPAETAEAPAAAEPVAEPEQAAPAFDIPAQTLVLGATVYSSTCASCHGAEAEGGVGPSLVGDGMITDTDRAIRLVINGGHIMPAFGSLLDDEQIGNVLTYVRNSWGNEFGPVTADEVAAQR